MCAAGVLVILGIFAFVDYVWNGTFVDWFTRNYMRETGSVYAGKDVIIREPSWPELKKLIFTVLAVSIVFWIAVVFAVSHFYAKSREKKTVTAISQEIQSYMQANEDRPDSFPKEFAEIAAQMVTIKSTMQRHEQVLQEEAAKKNDLIAYLAHDLKTPLTSVIGYLSLLDEASDMPAEQRIKYVNITLDKAKRLEQLINEFFEITRYNLQHIELQKESIDLCYMLVQMADEFYPILNAHNNTVELSVPDNMMIYGDADKLARVFNNILKNAVTYSYPGTVIKIWAEKTGTDIKIYFQNKGKTIPAHKLETIFEKFFRLDEARTTNTGGAGLGLAIAKEIAILHGGAITAASRDELTTFCVTLPVTENEKSMSC